MRVRLHGIDEASARRQPAPQNLAANRDARADDERERAAVFDRLRQTARGVAELAVHGHAVAIERTDNARDDARLAGAEKVVLVTGRQADVGANGHSAPAAPPRVVFATDEDVAETRRGPMRSGLNGLDA